MSGIRILNWTYIWRCSIITPVSTILLQENSFKPASSGLFFCSPVLPACFFRHLVNPANASYALLLRSRKSCRVRWWCLTFDYCHSVVTNAPYTLNHLRYTQPICVMAAGVLHQVQHTNRLRLLARSWVVPASSWRAFFSSH